MGKVSVILRWRVAVVFAAIACAAAAGADVPKGIVRAERAAFADARGPWLPLGATLFWAPWGYRSDRARLERELALLSSSGVDYIRVLGQVGGPGTSGEDSWSDRRIDPNWTNTCGGAEKAGCASYDEVIAGLTDLAFDRYGLRVEWTIFGSTDFTPTPAARRGLVDRFLRMADGREHNIFHFEIANEFYHNGFEGTDGLAELRDLGRYLQERTQILVALSAPRGADCGPIRKLYAGGVGDVVTEHFNRAIDGPAGVWEPVRLPWSREPCDGVPVLRSSNEPIGPFSSVKAEHDPLRLAMAAAVSYVSGVGAYVLHTGAGIRGGGRSDRERGRPADIADVPRIEAIFRALRAVRSRLPPDVANWGRFDAGAPNPIVSVGKTDALVAAYGARRGDRFVVTPIGVRGTLTLRAHAALALDVFDPRTGKRVAGGSLASGETVSVSGSAGYLVVGQLTTQGAEQ